MTTHAREHTATTGETVITAVEAAGERYEFSVDVAGSKYDIWYQADRPLAGGAEAALVASLLPAMREGTALRVDAPIDAMLLERLDDIQGVFHAWNGQWAIPTELHRIPVAASPAEPVAYPPGRGRLAFFSGGVDSYDILVSVPSIDHLLFVGGFDIFVDDPHLPAIHERLERAARRLGKPLIHLDTNIKDLADYHVPWLTYFGAGMASAAMLLTPIASSAHIGGTIPYRQWRPNGSHPLLDHLWSTSGLRFVAEGGGYMRIDKVARIADHPVARDELRVCWAGPTEEFNCGRCEKCLRTMVMLEIVGARRHFRSFPEELDLEAVARVRVTTPYLYEDWRSAQDALRERGGPPELAEAVDACLRANVDVAAPRPAEIWDLARRDRILTEVLESSSWRLTAPLRGARRMLRSRSRRAAT
ncbi:MAG TPA: hypothetical protein VHF58_00275 [Solirubrobacterales bacterium]|nr:hypothetical protein [Solirubrobacterales bacterium]